MDQYNRRLKGFVIKEMVEEDEILEFRKNMYIDFEGYSELEALEAVLDTYILSDDVRTKEFQMKLSGYRESSISHEAYD